MYESKNSGENIAQANSNKHLEVGTDYSHNTRRIKKRNVENFRKKLMGLGRV